MRLDPNDAITWGLKGIGLEKLGKITGANITIAKAKELEIVLRYTNTQLAAECASPFE
jgi:Flp pilus assembly protein TadD